MPILDRTMADSRNLPICLTGVLLSLLLVGAVSGTFVRHAVQVTPIAFVLMAFSRGSHLAPYFALPIFVIWALLMALIWLYLFGIQTLFSGSFSTTEVVLTIFIGGFCVLGMTACLRRNAAPVRQRIAGFGLFTVIQAAAMWVSFLPGVANR